MVRFISVGAVALALLISVGCQKKEEAPKPSEAPVRVQTQAEIASQFQSAYRPLEDAVTAGQDVPRTMGDSIAGALRSAKAKNQALENGPAAIQQVSSELDDLIKKANEKKLWGVVVCACDAFAAIDPQSDKSRYRDRALVQLNRPRVRITSSIQIPDHSDKTVFFLDVYLPDKNKTQTVRASVGDEFLGLKFLDVIGRDEGIKLEYKATGDIFSVMRSR